MVFAVIVAGGKGVRMDSKTRKQYLLLNGVPILSHTLLAFDKCSDIDRIFLDENNYKKLKESTKV